MRAVCIPSFTWMLEEEAEGIAWKSDPPPSIFAVAVSSCVTLGVWLNFSESHFRDPKTGVIYPEMLSALKGVDEWMRESG